MTEDGHADLVREVLFHSLPEFVCSSCRQTRKRRSHRVRVITSWDARSEIVCDSCWLKICEAAGMFMLLQQAMEL